MRPPKALGCPPVPSSEQIPIKTLSNPILGKMKSKLASAVSGSGAAENKATQGTHAMLPGFD